MKSLPFHIPEDWKRYPFRVEPPRIGSTPPGVPTANIITSLQRPVNQQLWNSVYIRKGLWFCLVSVLFMCVDCVAYLLAALSGFFFWYTLTPPHNGHLSTKATFPCPQNDNLPPMLAALKCSRIHGGNFKAVFEFYVAANSLKRQGMCNFIWQKWC